MNDRKNDGSAERIENCNGYHGRGGYGFFGNMGRYRCYVRTAEINGISHLLEHMAFKGTVNRTARQIAEEIENVGGFINACTSRETTSYYIKVLKEDTALAVDILADILQNSTFDPEEFAREKRLFYRKSVSR